MCFTHFRLRNLFPYFFHIFSSSVLFGMVLNQYRLIMSYVSLIGHEKNNNKNFDFADMHFCNCAAKHKLLLKYNESPLPAFDSTCVLEYFHQLLASYAQYWKDLGHSSVSELHFLSFIFPNPKNSMNTLPAPVNVFLTLSLHNNCVRENKHKFLSLQPV